MSCFWTALLNAEQDCTGGGSDALSQAGPVGNCGGSLGRFKFDEGSISEDLQAALDVATTVTITGVYQDDIAAGDLSAALGDPIPEYVTFEAASYEVTFVEGIYFAWITDTIPALDAEFVIWFRVDIDGEIFYGATSLITSC